MLLSRAEMSFDFGGAQFDRQKDRQTLAFIMSQFLYGEVTGIQCGLWLYRAPDLEAARFFAKQATEELSHVQSFQRILELLGEAPQPAHRLIRLLAEPADSFPEHVALEMALGEGLVLMVFYALCDTMGKSAPDIVRILEAAIKQEEKHVAFGEARTMAALQDNPRLRRSLLGQALLNLTVLRRLGKQLAGVAPEHPVMALLPAFVDHAVTVSLTRLRRMGLWQGSVDELRGFRRFALMAQGLGGRLARRLLPRRHKLLTDTYLTDPQIQHAEH